MLVLVINCGSSSIKADIVHAETGARTASARIQRVGSDECSGTVCGADGVKQPLADLAGADHHRALGGTIAALLGHLDGISLGAVGHRVVHGGAEFTEPTLITDAVEAQIEALFPLAPLHNPPNLAGIRAARAVLPDLPHIAVFDTAFHSTLPRRARAYALPQEVVEAHGIRRYGFHGTSHRFVAERAADFLGEDLDSVRIITCHLGNGASATAVEYGRSVETTMGMTPLEGLVMGTRSGDVDPGVLLTLLREGGMSVDELDTLLNRKSGLAGLSGIGNDMRDIQARAAEGDERCRLALQVYCHRLRKTIGGLAAVMGGVDAIVFTGGIGENSALVRHRAAQRLEFLGARLDEDANRSAGGLERGEVAEISLPHSRCRILAIGTDEERVIAKHAAGIARGDDILEAPLTIPIAVSGRHLHLTQEAVEVLFGAGHTLTPHKPLSQPGQFACKERVALVGPRGRIDRVRVLGPVRSKCQVEVSRTDEFKLGIDAPVRRSGDVANSPGITLEGSEGRTLTLTEGVICAWRHIHMRPEDAEAFGVAHKDVVEVAVNTTGRDLIFGDVMVRVKSSYALEMHIDTDEANAAEISTGAPGLLVTTGCAGSLRRKSLTIKG